VDPRATHQRLNRSIGGGGISSVCVRGGIRIPLAIKTDLFEALRANDEPAVASVVRNTGDTNSKNAHGIPGMQEALGAHRSW